jgi:zinc protease
MGAMGTTAGEQPSTTGSFLQVERGTIDGVQALWAPTPGPLTAMLMFRVGRADETLRTLGASHLVEHLALWSSRRLTHPHNGWVEDGITGFHASGTEQEVCAFLREVTASLTDLPLDRLEVERRVLGAEAASRSGGAYAYHRALRFGPSGYGLLDQYEFAIDWLPAAAVADWSRTRFTAENAVLWLSGEPPQDLSLSLPTGSRHAPVVPRPIPGVRFPAQDEAEVGGVSLSFMTPRTAEAHAAFGILVERTVDELRSTAGMSYAPQGAYDILDGDTVNAVLLADCRRPDAPDVRRAMVALLTDLAERGPTQDDLDRDRRRLVEWLTDPEAGPSLLDWRARNDLLGVPAMDAQAMIDEREAMTTAAVAASLADCLPSLLVVGPAMPAIRDADSPAPYETPEAPTQSGTRFTATAQWRGFHVDIRVDLSADGLTYWQRHTDRKTPPVTRSLLFEDCVAGVRLTSGGLTLVARDGGFLNLHPERLTSGGELLGAVERALGSERIVPLSGSQIRVAAAVAEELDAEDTSGLGGEIDRLPAMLGEREELERLAAARHGAKEGLVALTSQRFLFVFCGPGSTDVIEVPRDGTAKVAVKGALRKQLVLEYDGVTAALRDFRPPVAMREIGLVLAAAGEPASAPD